jgi:hypothetical protein
MFLFKNIGNFNDVGDYLPIVNAVINTDLLVIFLLYHRFFKSSSLKKWYKNYQLSAVIADVLIIVIGIIIARYIYTYFLRISSFSIWKFIGIALLVQITHDILFYLFFNTTPIGYSQILDFFKGYAKEMGGYAIFGDSCMMIFACLLSSYFASMSLNTNIIILIFSVYLVPYMINME